MGGSMNEFEMLVTPAAPILYRAKRLLEGTAT